MRGKWLAIAAVSSVVLGAGALGQDRIATPEDIRASTHPGWLGPLRVTSWPHRALTGGMERGLIAFERHRVRERAREWMEEWRRRGLELQFGGSGEGSGIGGGASYQLRGGENNSVGILGLVTVRRYQEAGLNWAWTTPAGRLVAESSYQWRPEENFYGLGHDSERGKHSQFALRQSWLGVRYELKPIRRMRAGILHRVAWVSALPGRNPIYSSPDAFTSGLPGYGTQTRLESTGAYFDLDGIRQEYQLGGAVHLGASHQQGLGASKLDYFAYETQMEGRLPAVPQNSAFVGQANIELNRPRGGSDPIPFYLLPHIGGSSTLRGFALDRFYGTNLMLLSLEYRYSVHPNLQAAPFFDEGQVFDRTSNLSWLNWHRNYGLGFRFRSPVGTFLRVEYGRSSEGFQVHVNFGYRERPPLLGPFRYGAYRR
jgi:hypothetical protein